MVRLHSGAEGPATEAPLSGFRDERARRFLAAMRRYPDARRRELDCLSTTIRRLGVGGCHVIVDLGAGHGYATGCLREFLLPDGLLYAVDGSEDMLDQLPPDPQVRRILAGFDRLTCLGDGSADLCVTHAAFHHVINKNQVLLEMKRVLQPGGCLVIGDVADGTPTQRFFDEVVRYHCITGHEADFLTEAWVRMMAERAGLEWVSSTLEQTPWRFARSSDLLAFVRDLFSLTLGADELRAAVEETFDTRVDPGSGETQLLWTMSYHVLRKRAGDEGEPRA